ncbi:hypothetical protein HDV01_001582 [Terramyces sp. JEL0728]|nr:hypothetical protein HDV01_001582 [Terramyces sp. JEL0728]
MTGTPAGNEEIINGIKCYVATPTNPNSHAVIIATDIFGYTLANARLTADSFAKEGYFCVVPDLFNGTEPPADLMANFDHLMTKYVLLISRTCTYYQKTVAFLRLSLYGPPFILFNSASSGIKIIKQILPEVKKNRGKVAVQGGLNYPDDVEKIVVPTFFVNAEMDHAITVEQKDLIAKTMEKKGSKFDSKLYPGVKHGFAVRGDENDENVCKQRAQAFIDSVSFYKTIFNQ